MTSYGHDVLNRMSQVTALSDFGTIGNIVSSYTYDPVGNLATVAYPNGVTPAGNLARVAASFVSVS